jgi:hypothetical protein
MIFRGKIYVGCSWAAYKTKENILHREYAPAIRYSSNGEWYVNGNFFQKNLYV